MTTGSETLYYVLREGSTREEQWSWNDLEQLCRTGDLTARTRIFLPDEQRWVALEETRLAAASGEPGAANRGGEDEHRSAVEAEYQAALARANEDPGLLEARLDAGILAAELGRKDEAREHFQSVLHRFPYHARTAGEVHRRFSRAEQRSFRYLDRPAPVWDDLGDLVRMPFARGPLYVAIPAAVFAALSWVPGGSFAIAAIVFLWAFQIMEYTARGANKPAQWNRSFSDPVRKLARPAALMSAVVGQWAMIVLGGAAIAWRLKGPGDVSLWGFTVQSPVMLVLGSLIGVLYLPAAMVSIGGFTGSVARTLDPRHLGRTIVRMEHEYVYTVFILAGIGVALGLVRMVTGMIPIAGDVVFGTALACATTMAGLVLGRLLGRMGHVIE
jgi:hypothetical protein